MALAPRMNEEQIRETFNAIRERNPEVESLAVRTDDGRALLFSSGPHESLWETTGNIPESSREFLVPIAAAGKHWGQLEVRFQEVSGGRLATSCGLSFRCHSSLGEGCLFHFRFTFEKC